jgi:hypothetical protein
LTVIGSVGSGIMNSLTDSLVMKVTATHGSNFGKIRVWGTLGWGMFNLFLGQLNSISSHILPLYVPGLILFALLSCVNCLFVIFFFAHLLPSAATISSSSPSAAAHLETSLKSSDSGCSTTTKQEVKVIPSDSLSSLNERKKKTYASCTSADSRSELSLHTDLSSSAGNESLVRIVLLTFVHHPRLIQYALLCTLVGVLTSIHWQFFPWFLDTLSHQDPSLIAYTAAVQCFLGEIPLLYFASRVVEWIGMQASLNLVLATFSVRYLYYSQLTPRNVYWVLAIEFTQGITFGLFYFILNRLAADYGLKASRLQFERKRLRAEQLSRSTSAHGYTNAACVSGSPAYPNSATKVTPSPSCNIHCPALGHFDEPTPRRPPTLATLQRNVSKDEIDHPQFGTPSSTSTHPFESCCWHTAQKDFPHDEFSHVHRHSLQTPDVLRSIVGDGYEANLTPTSLSALNTFDRDEKDSNSAEVLPSHTTSGSSVRSSVDRTDGGDLAKQFHDDHLPLLSDAESRIFASIQGVLSGLYEGLGVAIGAFASGHLIQDFGFARVWIGGSSVAAAALALNVSVAVIICIVKRISSRTVATL